MRPLIVSDVTRRFILRPVLDGVSLTVSPGQRVGLVGENGSGKSTLIRIVVGVDEPDGGTVARPDDLGYLPQQPTFPAGSTVADVLADALTEHRRVLAELESVGARLADDPHVAPRYGDLLEWATDHDAWDAERRGHEAAARLGLDVEPERPVGEMSGGEQVRLALACLMARQPEAVVLDEPTNHLDHDALEVLEQWLLTLPGAVLVASHDRTFLDHVATHLVDLDPNPVGVDGEGGNTFTGAFTDYLAAKRRARARWEQQWEREQDDIKDLRVALRTTARNVGHRGTVPRDNDKSLAYAKAQSVEVAVTRRVRDTQRRLDEAEEGQVRKPRPELRFDLPALGESRGVALATSGVVLRGTIRVPDLQITAGEHVLLTGPNGSGKSSLLAAFAGELEPTAGRLSAGRLAYLPQDARFTDPERTVREEFAARTDGEVSLSELGLVHPRDLAKPVGLLSFGQQRRLELAIAIARRPSILLLDEPTNHISLVLASELEEALAATPATVVVASHDRWLRDRWTGRRVELGVAR